MSKFKIGDRVLIKGWNGWSGSSGDPRGREGFITSPGFMVCSAPDGGGDYLGIFEEEDLELIKGEQTMESRKFRLLKEMPAMPKGTILELSNNKRLHFVGHKSESDKPRISSSIDPDKYPKFFEEVWPIEPVWGNKDEVAVAKKKQKKTKK